MRCGEDGLAFLAMTRRDAPGRWLQGMDALLEKLEAVEPTQRWLLVGLLVLLLGGGYYYFHASYAMRLETLDTGVQELKQSVQKHQSIAARYDELTMRLAELDAALNVAVTLLPETREIPELLTQVSRLGGQAGLEFRLFRGEPERRRDFYVEVPLTLTILGKFHDVATFFDHVSRLPRIVHVTGIKMTRSPTKERDAEPVLTTNCLVTTFRFLELREADSTKDGRPDNPQRGN